MACLWKQRKVSYGEIGTVVKSIKSNLFRVYVLELNDTMYSVELTPVTKRFSCKYRRITRQHVIKSMDGPFVNELL